MKAVFVRIGILAFNKKRSYFRTWLHTIKIMRGSGERLRIFIALSRAAKVINEVAFNNLNSVLRASNER